MIFFHSTFILNKALIIETKMPLALNMEIDKKQHKLQYFNTK